MTPVSDGWASYYTRTVPAGVYDARVRAEIERAYYAGAEHVVDTLQGLNDAGLTMPFAVAKQLDLWTSETIAHHSKYGATDE